MTSIYFVRHCQSGKATLDDSLRPLTEEGLRDSHVVAEVLRDRDINAIISSPYERTMKTIGAFAAESGLEIIQCPDLRERGIGAWKGGDFFENIRRQWADFDYRIEGGECLREVQERCVRAVLDILDKYEGKRIAVCSHGTALSTVFNYFYPDFGADEFFRIVDLMPFIIRFDLEGRELLGHELELIIRKRYKK